MGRSCLLLAYLLVSAAAVEARRFPSILLVTVDTLRADRLSSYGYGRTTSPNIDRLLTAGARFETARTVEPLTNPALSSMLTSLYPHEHGATRNGLSIRPDLPSFVRHLQKRGFATAAFVGNWTLKRELSGLHEHFESYQEVFSRKRWFILKGEATAQDLTAEALAWAKAQRRDHADRPFLLWVHYVEPHAPYRNHHQFQRRLGLTGGSDLPPEDRYDTEVAFVDEAVGELVRGVESLEPAEDLLTVFAADHGESLGEHGYWGHGRHLYEPSLRIPLGIRWPGRIEPQGVAAPASILDVGPTVLGLLGYPDRADYRGFDWAPVLDGLAPPPESRTLLLQSHKGAVQPVEDATRARRRGLLSVGLVREGIKETLRLPGRYLHFDLARDPGEIRGAVGEPSPRLREWLQLVREGLAAADDLAVPELDSEARERLRALGYL